jgi:histidyl-tRNA synthetase
MNKLIRGIRGFKDIPPDEAFRHRYAEESAKRHFGRFGYREVRLPIVEPTELFKRGIGEATDIVEKEMYTFPDRNGASLTLRPEGTASAVRAYLEGGWKIQGGITRIFYTGPMFRYERPQKGRYRQFYQIGLEALGGPGPMVDVEVIDLLNLLFVELGIRDVRILVNSLGCPVCRPAFREDLVKYIRNVAGGLCSNCVRRVETNPMRVLDCKVPSCKETLEGAPVILDYLCGECDDHFNRVTGGLTDLETPFEVDPRIVRGLDYYNRTAFEAVCGRLGSQDAVAAGGRYDGLAAEIGGDAYGIGFAMGLERLTLIMDWESVKEPVMDYYVASATDNARIQAMALADTLRSLGFRVETDVQDRSLKAQLKSAGKTGVLNVLILGEDELASGTVQIKNFATGEQETVGRKDFLAQINRQR